MPHLARCTLETTLSSPSLQPLFDRVLSFRPKLSVVGIRESPKTSHGSPFDYSRVIYRANDVLKYYRACRRKFRRGRTPTTPSRPLLSPRGITRSTVPRNWLQQRRLSPFPFSFFHILSFSLVLKTLSFSSSLNPSLSRASRTPIFPHIFLAAFSSLFPFAFSHGDSSVSSSLFMVFYNWSIWFRYVLLLSRTSPLVVLLSALSSWIILVYPSMLVFSGFSESFVFFVVNFYGIVNFFFLSKTNQLRLIKTFFISRVSLIIYKYRNRGRILTNLERISKCSKFCTEQSAIFSKIFQGTILHLIDRTRKNRFAVIGTRVRCSLPYFQVLTLVFSNSLIVVYLFLARCRISFHATHLRYFNISPPMEQTQFWFLLSSFFHFSM